MTYADQVLKLIRDADALGNEARKVGYLSDETMTGLSDFISGLRERHYSLCCSGCGQYKKGEGHGDHDECRC